jgi:hypothetical protein
MEHHCLTSSNHERCMMLCGFELDVGDAWIAGDVRIISRITSMKIMQTWINFIQAMNARRDVYDFPPRRSTDSQSIGNCSINSIFTTFKLDGL